MTQLELFPTDPTERMLDEIDDLLQPDRDRQRKRQDALAAARCALCELDHLPYRRVRTVPVSEAYL